MLANERWKFAVALAMVPFLALAVAQVSLDVALGSTAFCDGGALQGCGEGYGECWNQQGCVGGVCESEFESCAGEAGCDPGEGTCIPPV
jgi:hypothetical protein